MTFVYYRYRDGRKLYWLYRTKDRDVLTARSLMEDGHVTFVDAVQRSEMTFVVVGHVITATHLPSTQWTRELRHTDTHTYIQTQTQYPLNSISQPAARGSAVKTYNPYQQHHWWRLSGNNKTVSLTYLLQSINQSINQSKHMAPNVASELDSHDDANYTECLQPL